MTRAAPNAAAIRILWAAVFVLSVIGVLIVVRRTLTIAYPSPPRFPQAAEMDGGVARHPVLTMLHIVPGLVFILLGPVQFVRRIRTQGPAFHRWSGRVFTAAGVMIGTTALVMSAQMAIGGANETAATMFFAALFLFALIRGFVLIRARCVPLHREWMIRAYAIGLAVTTIRPIVGVFFATRALTNLTPREFFGTAFWIGFSLHLIAAEMWINYTRPRLAGERRA